MTLPSTREIDELLKEIEGITGLSAAFPQSRYAQPDQNDSRRYTALWARIDSRLKALRESGIPFSHPNPHQSLMAIWRWCWTLPGGASSRIARPRDLYADLITELKALRQVVSQGADAPGEVLRELRESRLRTNQLFVIMAFRQETEGFWNDVVQPSAEACRLLPIRIDKEELEGAISEEILSAIRRSLMVLCDLSFERPNCYFEAGFAKGSFRRVIFTARRDHDPRARSSCPYKVHFDVDQIRITWWQPEELAIARNEVEERVSAVLAQINDAQVTPDSTDVVL
jgi:hypothetical protein